MSAMCVPALSVNQQHSPFLWPQGVILEMEKNMQARIESAAAEIFERAGRPAGKEHLCRLAAERQLSLSRVRLIECADSITLFAFVPDTSAKSVSVFLTSRGVAIRSTTKGIRSRTKGNVPTTDGEQFLIVRWATEVDPHAAFGTLDGNTLCLTAWHLDSPKLKSRFKLWTLSNSRSVNLQIVDSPSRLTRQS